MSWSLAAADELAHPAGASSAWTETWELRLVDPRRWLGVAIVVVRRPAEGQVSYLASVVGAMDHVVVVHEHDIAAPRDGGLELRASGIWADHVCESPFSHWSVGLEAFGLRLDDPDEAVTTGRGHAIPVGWDLEWEDDAGPGPELLVDPDAGYRQRGIAHGELLIGEATVEVEGIGQRLHRWGTGPRLLGWTTDPVGPVGDGVAGGARRAVADVGDGTSAEWWLEAVETGVVLASRRRS